MTVAEIEALLRRTIGLDASTIGGSAVARAVALRVEATGSATIEGYGGVLRSDPAELQSLVEAVVVPETWFFRDAEAFPAMATVLRRLAAATERTLRLLSLPCSTGEEPYSMAMAALDAGLPAERLAIDGVDVSLRALAAAAAGVYGRNAFRGRDLAFRDRHFAPVAGGWSPSPAVRGPVRFARGNLFEPGLAASGGPYDVIFCRNLLIYFDEAGRAEAVGRLKQLLAPGGTLFVGPSEASLMARQGFASARIPLAFAFRIAETPTAPPPGPAPRKAPPARPPASVKAHAPARLAPPAPAAFPRPEAATRAADLDEARRLADRGALADAARIARDLLRSGRASADILHLLGVIADAGGAAEEAAELYRKALFLDPGHAEALAHLALLLEARGVHGEAALLRRRLRRAALREAK